MDFNLTKLYSKHSLQFYYPDGMVVKSKKWMSGSWFSSTSDEKSGIINGEYYPNEEIYNVIKISWLKPKEIKLGLFALKGENDEEKIVKQGLDAGYKLMSDLIDSSQEFIKNEIVTMIANEHKLIYQNYIVKISNKTFYGILGSWYCNKTQRAFTFNVGYSKDSILELFQQYVDLFKCH